MVGVANDYDASQIFDLWIRVLNNDLLLVLSPADRSTTMLVAFTFVILYVPLELIVSRVAKVLLGIADAMATGTARMAAKINVNFMMIKELGRKSAKVICGKDDKGKVCRHGTVIYSLLEMYVHLSMTHHEDTTTPTLRLE